MSDDIGIYTKSDRLLPMEKMRDSKKGVVYPEGSRKNKKERRGQALKMDADQEENEEPDDPSKDSPSGKILDIVI